MSRHALGLLLAVSLACTDRHPAPVPAEVSTTALPARKTPADSLHDVLGEQLRALDSIRRQLDSASPSARHSATYAAQFDTFRRRQAVADSLRRYLLKLNVNSKVPPPA